MKNRFLLFILVSTFCTNIKSQTKSDSIVYPKILPRFHFIPLGLGAECYLGKQTTLFIDFGANLAYTITETRYTETKNYFLYPYITIEPRKYTDLLTRFEKGRNIKYFSGAYGAFKVHTGYEMENNVLIVSLGPLVGWQRTFLRSAYINFAIGVGAFANTGKTNGFGMIADFGFGFVIF